MSSERRHISPPEKITALKQHLAADVKWDEAAPTYSLEAAKRGR